MRSIKQLFPKKLHQLSKEDYWKHWEFFELLDDLKLIEALLEKQFGANEFDQTIEGDTHAKLIGAIDDIEFGNKNDLVEIDELFQSGSKLHELLEDKEPEIIGNIQRRVNNWKDNHK